MAEYCNDGRYKVYQSRWLGTGKYRAKAGKNIAVMNTGSLTVQGKADLYNNKASNLLWVFSIDEVNTLNAAPYNIPKDRMITGMGPPINNLTPWLEAGIKRFNVDEPWHHKNVRCHTEYTPQWFKSVEDQLPADGKLYTSEFYHEACYWGRFRNHEDQGSTCESPGAHNTINHLIAQYASIVTSKTKLGTHSKWEYLDGFGVVTDPRGQWTQMRDQLAGQNKFEHGVVPTLHQSIHLIGWGRYTASFEEMHLIFGHANSLGANTIFIYVENTNGQYELSVLDNALHAAHYAGGWVDRQEERVHAVFCCETPTYDPDGCQFLELIPQGEFRWV